MIGILSAFGAATSWTYACFIWRSQTQKYKSIDINLVKNIIAFLIFIPAFINLSSTTELKNLLFNMLQPDNSKELRRKITPKTIKN